MSTAGNDQGSGPVPFIISRHLKAPRQLVWDVYTQAEHLMHWFGPKGVTMSNHAMDFRVDGKFHYCQALAGGAALWGMLTCPPPAVPV